jgi:hypothetical protein
MEAHALNLCRLGVPPLYLPAVLDVLCDRGEIDNAGGITAAGLAAWRAHCDALHDDACRWNTLWCLPEAALDALRSLVGGQEPGWQGEDALHGHSGLARRSRDGTWWISDAGRRCVELAADRC